MLRHRRVPRHNPMVPSLGYVGPRRRRGSAVGRWSCEWVFVSGPHARRLFSRWNLVGMPIQAFSTRLRLCHAMHALTSISQNITSKTHFGRWTSESQQICLNDVHLPLHVGTCRYLPSIRECVKRIVNGPDTTPYFSITEGCFNSNDLLLAIELFY